jgi:hypothetical protein
VKTPQQSHYYFEVMERLCVRMHRVKDGQFRNGRQLHHSRPCHSALNVTQLLAFKLICVIQHPSYSPDFAPADSILFPKVKLFLKGERFSNIQCGVTELLKGVSLHDFSAHSTTCIDDLSVV